MARRLMKIIYVNEGYEEAFDHFLSMARGHAPAEAEVDWDEDWDVIEPEVDPNPPVLVSLWQLAYDREAYGDRAGWWIIVTPDGDEEKAGPFATEEQARAHAARMGRVVAPLQA